MNRFFGRHYPAVILAVVSVSACTAQEAGEDIGTSSDRAADTGQNLDTDSDTGSESFPDADSDTDSDADVDSDSDADSDTDTDTDSDTDSDGVADPGTDPVEVCLEDSAPIRIQNQRDVVISGKRFSSDQSEPLVFVLESENVIIENCWFGPSAEEAVKFWRAKNVIVRNCYFEYVNTGVLAIETESVVVDNNNFLNIQGDMNNVVFLNNCTGPGTRVTNNRAENIEGQSSLEDLVNLYGSEGTEADPILVEGNHFRGGGPSQSGGGLMSGDSGGGWYIVRDNILVNPGNYGIAVAGGHDISLLNNLIYQDSKPWSHFPAYLWDWEDRFAAGGCYGHTIRGNKSTFYADTGALSPIWYGWNDNCTWNDISDNDWDAGLTADILPEKLWSNEMPDPAAVACFSR